MVYGDRIRIQLFSRGRLHNFAGVHYVYPVNVTGDDAQVMRNRDYRSTEPLSQPIDDFQQLGLYGNIE